MLLWYQLLTLLDAEVAVFFHCEFIEPVRIEVSNQCFQHLAPMILIPHIGVNGPFVGWNIDAFLTSGSQLGQGHFSAYRIGSWHPYGR